MRLLARPIALSLGVLVTGLLTPQAVRAQVAPDQYPQQYQQPPQQYPQQPPQYPQQYPQPEQYPQQYQQPQQYPPPDQYQQPQQYPPQYQQPQQPYPPQYQQPQQPYPQQYQQPQQYPQPQPYPQPRYYQPQPAYQPAPAYVAPAPRHGGLLLLPYLGLNIPTGDGSDNLSAGFRMGGILGVYVGPYVSLNGELTIDILNVDSKGGPSVTDIMFDWAFSPLFHLALPHLEIVLGPKIGFFNEMASYSSYGTDYTSDSYGIVYGFNAGAFFPLGRMAIGGMFNFTGHSYSHTCDYSDNCYDVSGGPDLKIIGFTGALLF